MGALLTNFNFLLAYGDEKALAGLDSEGRFRLLEKIVHSGPSEANWRAMLELLASWPEDEKKSQAYEWLHTKLESWDDRIRQINSAWTFLYNDGQLSSIARVARSVLMSRREQHGNTELKSIVSSPEIRNIKSLTIHKSDIYIGGLRALVDSPYLTNLTTLALEGLTLSDEKFQVLYDARHFNSLTRLRLKDVNLRLDRLQQLLHSSLIATVTDLEIPYNDLDKAAALALVKSVRPQLRVVLE